MHRRAYRFQQGAFQRSAIDFPEEIAAQIKYCKYWEEKYKDAVRKLDELMSGTSEAADEEEWTQKIEEQEAKVQDAANVIKQCRAELQSLQRLNKGTKTNPDLMPLMLTMANTNFAETFAQHVCSSSYTGVVFDIEFPEDADPSSMEHAYNEGTFVCAGAKRGQPIFLKLEEPGHMFCALIFPETKVCEIWNTAKVPKNVQRFFVALLPHYYTVMCINAQLQIKWCETGAENVYIVKQKTGKPLVNIYCQAWPYFFAYMRCVRKVSALDLLKFLSCMTDEQKTVLIDTFNTALANRGKDVQYISEINDAKHFQSYVRQCDPLLNMQKSIKYVGPGDYKDYKEIVSELDDDDFARDLRLLLGKRVKRKN